ncbi:MAG: SRPBCC domain-containing protein [bacterium]|nr:SRPBCC domain-containing protein [bacterium]
MKKKGLYAFAILAITISLLSTFGKKDITTEITMDAPINTVWLELTDFSKYPDWNPFIKKLTGDIKEGNTIEVTFHAKGSDPMVFTPEIKLKEKNKILQWEGKFLLPGIFTGKHTFELTKLEENKTKLVQKENFKGILVPFFNFDSTEEGFNLMNKELKKRVEKTEEKS